MINNPQMEQLLTFAKMIGAKERNAYTTVKFYRFLLSQAHRLATMDVHRCNGTRYQGEGEYETACKRLYATLNEFTGQLGLEYYHQSDPRGASLYIAKLDPRKGLQLRDTNYSSVGLAIY